MFSALLKSQLKHDTPYAWFLRSRASYSPLFRQQHLAELDERLEAYLDCYLISEQAGASLLPDLNPEDWGSCFVYAVLAIRLHNETLFATALDHLKPEAATHYREIADACLWDGPDNLSPWLLKLYRHPSPIAQQAAVAVARAIPGNMHPDILQTYLANSDPALQIQLLNWLGEHQYTQALPFITERYTHDNPAIAFAAARAGFLLQAKGAKSQLESFALTENPHMLDAITLLFIQAQPAQLTTWVNKLWHTDKLSIRVKLYGTAVAGLSTNIDRLLPPMAEPETAKIAGEAFTLITGIDIENNDLDAIDETYDNYDDENLADTATLAEQLQTDPLTADWEDDLPTPCPTKITQWWQKNANNFQLGTRYLAGLELNATNLKRIQATGNQRQRHIAALHLLISHHEPWFDCGWPTRMQQSAT